jgi:hypothetical protein
MPALVTASPEGRHAAIAERAFVMTTRRLPAPPRPRGLAGRVFLDSERRLRLGWRLLSYLALVVSRPAASRR